MSGKRGNQEGSIYPYRNGFAAYVWVTTPTGERKRKYAYGKTRPEVHEKWLKLHAEASKGPVATKHRTVAAFLKYWLESIVRPNLAPLTYASYESAVRLYIAPHLGTKRLDKLTVRDVREWLNLLAETCQCCAQGKDAARSVEQRPRARQRQCCAIGQCCESYTSRRMVQAARDALRAALTHALAEEEVSKNVAKLVKVPRPRKRKVRPWSVAEAKEFLEFSRERSDPLYAAWALVLTLGLRRGEVLGLTWDAVDLDAGELYVGEQLQRIGRQLVRRETKTEDSDDFLPLPALCLAALRLRRQQQDKARVEAGELWQPSGGLVFTTRFGTPIEPGNLTRMFPARSRRAGLRVIRLHDTRHTCGSLLVALDVHPRVAMKILRHSQISITMEIYSHVTDEQTREALRKLGDLLT